MVRWLIVLVRSRLNRRLVVLVRPRLYRRLVVLVWPRLYRRLVVLVRPRLYRRLVELVRTRLYRRLVVLVRPRLAGLLIVLVRTGLSGLLVILVGAVLLVGVRVILVTASLVKAHRIEFCGNFGRNRADYRELNLKILVCHYHHINGDYSDYNTNNHRDVTQDHPCACASAKRKFERAVPVFWREYPDEDLEYQRNHRIDDAYDKRVYRLELDMPAVFFHEVKYKGHGPCDPFYKWNPCHNDHCYKGKQRC